VAIGSLPDGTTLTAGATIPITIDIPPARVPVASVDLVVNGVTVARDNQAPFEFLFTVPSGVSSLSVSASATDNAGTIGTSAAVTAAVVADPLTTIQGHVVDRLATPVSGASLTVDLHGASVEVFDFDTTLDAVPNLTGRTPNRVLIASAINLRNPDGVFGADPFGFGTSLSHAARIGATLKSIGASAYTFTLGANAGGQLFVNGEKIIDIAFGDRFQEATTTIDAPTGPISVEILTFDNGNPEVRLSYSASVNENPELLAASGAIRAAAAVGSSAQEKVVPTGELTPAVVPLRATSQADGSFAIAGVPTVLGDVVARATAVIDGKTQRGHSGSTSPVPAGITDVGVVRLADFTALYAAAFNGPTGPASLYSIDPVTSAATLIGPIGFWRVSAMDVSEDGTVYAVGRDPVTRKSVLLTIDLATGAGTAIGPTGVEQLGFGDTIADISFRPSDHVLFAYLEAGDGLGTIDLATGRTTALGSTGVSCCGNGMAFTPDGRLLHANEDALHLLNQTTGAATTLVPLIYPAIGDARISSMDFDPATGELFGFVKSDNGTFLVKVDVTSGVVRIVGAGTVSGMDAIAWGPAR